MGFLMTYNPDRLACPMARPDMPVRIFGPPVRSRDDTYSDIPACPWVSGLPAADRLPPDPPSGRRLGLTALRLNLDRAKKFLTTDTVRLAAFRLDAALAVAADRRRDRDLVRDIRGASDLPILIGARLGARLRNALDVLADGPVLARVRDLARAAFWGVRDSYAAARLRVAAARAACPTRPWGPTPTPPRPSRSSPRLWCRRAFRPFVDLRRLAYLPMPLPG
jgi:hypothetical protein